MKRKNKAYSLQRSSKVLLWVLIPVLLINLIIGGIVISIVRGQTTQYLSDTAKLYIDRISDTFASIKHFMGYSAINDENLEFLSNSPPYRGDFTTHQQELFSRFYEFQFTCGGEYSFFLYLKDKDYFTNLAPMALDLREFKLLKKEAAALTAENNLYESYFRLWTIIQLDGEDYLLNLVPYHNLYLLCVVSVDSFLAPLEDLKLGEGGSVSLSTSTPSASPLFGRFTSFTEPIENAAFEIEIRFDNFGVFEKIMVVQLLVLMISISLAVLSGAVVLFMKKRVLAPLRFFSDNLKSFDETSEPLDFKSSDIIELEQVNLQFKNLISQIKRLKIDIYEKELEHQQVQLDYMQLQIKPHFFLNCLTNIYSMAQVGMNEEIERLCLSTSDYFRYIFQNTGGFVALESEIAHVRDYLDIQKTSFGEELTYIIEADPAVARTKIPPLILQTFVENAVKYAVTLNRQDCITVKAFPDGAHTVISIADTGSGFPPEILEKLQAHIPLERVNGHHIGIANALRRLQLTYKSEFSLTFENRETGALITLTIPNEP